ncbi:MAG: carboxypeptidase regulatory-like domain-containing protein [Planctomycetota bacterium]
MKYSIVCLLVFLGPFASFVAAQEEGWGNLTGQIVVAGDAPKNDEEPVGSNKDRAACLVDGKVPLDDAIVVSDENELKNVFVIMYTGRGANKPDSFHPMYDKSKTATMTLDNQKCRFVPKALFARTGQKLALKNSDGVGHNCRIATFNHEHNVNIPPNSSVEITLGDDDDKLPGDVFCDIHKWMDSIIFVRENPYVAITDENGKFMIENIPPGEWTFQFWHKKAGYMKTLEVDGYKLGRRGETEIKIEAGKELDLGKLTFDAGDFKD